MTDSIGLCFGRHGRLAVILAGAVFTNLAQAQNVTVSSGVVARMDTIGSLGGAPNNADVRVYLKGVTSFCPNANDGTWAFINISDPNYKAIEAQLMMAYATGKTVTVYAAPATWASGTYCQIGWINGKRSRIHALDRRGMS